MTKSDTLSKIYEKFQRGDSLTDDEVFNFYYELISAYNVLDKMGDKFFFAKREIYNIMHTLYKFIENRGLKI